MSRSLLKGALLGGIVLFVWSAISWMALPWHAAALNAFPDETALRSVLSTLKHDGIYVLPDPKAAEQSQNPSMSGPMFFASYTNSVSMNMGRQLGIHFVLQVFAALLGTWLLLQAKPATYGGGVAVFAGVGILIGVASQVPFMNWWQFPVGYGLGEMADFAISWTLAGLVVAKVAR